MSADSNQSGAERSWPAADKRKPAWRVPAEARSRTGNPDNEGHENEAERSAGAPGGSAASGPIALRHPDFAHFIERATRPAEHSSKLPPLSLKDWRDLAESWRISQALRSCAGNRSAAARELGIGRRTLYAKMEKLGIEPRW